MLLLVAVVLLSWQAHAALQAASVRSDGTDLLLNTANGEGEVTVDGSLHLKAAHATQLLLQVRDAGIKHEHSMDTQADHNELKAMFLAYQAQTDATISTLTQAFTAYKAESEVRSLLDACVAVLMSHRARLHG